MSGSELYAHHSLKKIEGNRHGVPRSPKEIGTNGEECTTSSLYFEGMEGMRYPTSHL